MEITKTVELKNIMLLVMKKIWSSVNPVCKNIPSLQNDVQTNSSSVVQMLFKTIRRHFDNLFVIDLVD